MEASNPANPPKYSRYRTVRARAATLQTLSSHSDTDPAPLPPPLPKAATFTPGDPDVPVKRAPSRYRRNNPVLTEAPPLPKVNDEHATNDASRSPKQNVTSPSRYHNTVRHHEHKARAEPQQQVSYPHAAGGDVPRQESELRAHHHRQLPAPGNRYDAAREEARLILEGEYDRLHRMKAEAAKQRHNAGHAVGSHAPDMKRRKDTVKCKEPKSPKPDSMPEKQAVQESKVPKTDVAEDLPLPIPPPSAFPPSPSASPKRGFRKFMPGSPRQEAPKSPPQPNASPALVTSPLASASTPPVSAPAEPLSTAVQHYDAPISASNAGDRRVTVKFDTSTITLPVTPSTTAKDLLNSASIVLSAAPDPRTSTLIECYTTPTLSLERPLRRYERIRDVLNSWDTDTDQHLLVLAASSDHPTPRGLDLKDVPPTAGQDITLQMQHSSRLGRWDKRWVRLQPNGQVSVSKHESSHAATNICHLSDFDLYAPTRKMIKRLKPPRGKNAAVFAVKSQQKSAMFLDDDDDNGNGKINFAHVFASPSKDVADRWYAAVHGWRSWYLVNMLGEGRVPASGTGEVLGEARAELRTHARKASRPDTSASAETVPYQLGSFRPLLDLDFGKIGSKHGGGDVDNGGPLSAPAVGRRSSAEARRSVDLRTASPRRSGTVRARPLPPTATGAPPTAFPTHRLVMEATDCNSMGGSGARVGGHTLLQRSGDEDAAGFTGKGLLWQQAAANQSSAYVEPGAVYEDTNAGFTGKGLLARSATQRSQGGRLTGRGVLGSSGAGAGGGCVGGPNGKPLVDLKGHSEFADGSLLRQLEAWRVRNGDEDRKV